MEKIKQEDSPADSVHSIHESVLALEQSLHITVVLSHRGINRLHEALNRMSVMGGKDDGDNDNALTNSISIKARVIITLVLSSSAILLSSGLEGLLAWN